jgi:hypothetical protein
MDTNYIHLSEICRVSDIGGVNREVLLCKCVGESGLQSDVNSGLQDWRSCVGYKLDTRFLVAHET